MQGICFSRKCITYIVLHPISVKPNKSQQFHEKMYTIQELNYYICSNLCMSFSKKSQVFFASLAGGNTRCINWIFFHVYDILQKSKAGFWKLIFRFSKIQVKQNLFNSNANICISGKDVYCSKGPTQGYYFRILYTHSFLSNQL